MAAPVTLYRFQIELSDVDRGVYETLDFRAAQHPSETSTYLLTRVLAFCLSFEENLAFTAGGLSDPDAPALRSLGPNGETALSIEIGNPSARRLHKTSKASRKVQIYTYKDSKRLMEELAAERIHRSAEIEIFSFSSKFIEEIAAKLQRLNVWRLVRNQESLMLSVGDETLDGEITKLALA